MLCFSMLLSSPSPLEQGLVISSSGQAWLTGERLLIVLEAKWPLSWGEAGQRVGGKGRQGLDLEHPCALGRVEPGQNTPAWETSQAGEETSPVGW